MEYLTGICTKFSVKFPLRTLTFGGGLPMQQCTVRRNTTHFQSVSTIFVPDLPRDLKRLQTYQEVRYLTHTNAWVWVKVVVRVKVRVRVLVSKGKGTSK